MIPSCWDLKILERRCEFMSVSHLLPIGLEKTPLIDAIFEMRFVTSAPFASVMTGIIYSKLPGEKQIEQLPVAQFPKEIRDSDPNLEFAPTIKISWGDFWIFLGDRVFSVACKIPYPGWGEFKKAIYEAFEVACDPGLVGAINRYSMKYINLIEIPDGGFPADFLNLSAEIGGKSLSRKSFQVRTDFEEPPYVHTIQLVSQASVNLIDIGHKGGAVIDVDSVCQLSMESPKEFLEKLDLRSTEVHLKAKSIFFGCLSSEALDWLGPIYE